MIIDQDYLTDVLNVLGMVKKRGCVNKRQH